MADPAGQLRAARVAVADIRNEATDLLRVLTAATSFQGDTGNHLADGLLSLSTSLGSWGRVVRDSVRLPDGSALT
jgi:hypothetical protein